MAAIGTQRKYINFITLPETVTVANNNGQHFSSATEEKVTSSYVTRVIYVAMMAPDLALRILKGDHPPTLNAKKLLDMVPLPERWDDQRQILGMRD
jgi:hypothetical protein